MENKITLCRSEISIFCVKTLEQILDNHNVQRRDNIAHKYHKTKKFAGLLKTSGALFSIYERFGASYYYDFFFDKSSFFNRDKWDLFDELKSFNLHVTDNYVWIADFDYFDDIGFLVKEIKEDYIKAIYPFDPSIRLDSGLSARRVHIPNGIYHVALQVYVSKAFMKDSEKIIDGLGYGFKLLKVDKLLNEEQLLKNNTILLKTRE